MPLARIIFVVGMACITGCTTGRLRQRTINQGSSLPEMQYQQVLGNLALFATNPSALPWHVNLREGTTQITDAASAGALVALVGPPATFPQAFGSRTIVAQWGMLRCRRRWTWSTTERPMRLARISAPHDAGETSSATGSTHNPMPVSNARLGNSNGASTGLPSMKFSHRLGDGPPRSAAK